MPDHGCSWLRETGSRNRAGVDRFREFVQRAELARNDAANVNAYWGGVVRGSRVAFGRSRCELRSLVL
jgi:hypothetical protein